MRRTPKARAARHAAPLEGRLIMRGPLDGIRVIDLTSGPVGGMATMILADFGADVIKVERPGGDPFRFLSSAPMWLRGKRSVELDLKREEDRDRLLRLAETADVVIAAFRGSAAVALGCDYDVLAARNAGLVYCQISAFGPRGPYAGYPGYEGVVAAKSGRMQAFAELTHREGPQFAAVQVASHAASQAAVTGILAALMARDRIGSGQYIETSLLRGMLPYDLAGLPQASLLPRDPVKWSRPPIPLGRMPTINYQPVMAKDGRWIQLGNLLQHLFDNFVVAAGMTDIFADGQHAGSPAEWPEEARETFRDRMLLTMRERTTEEWMRIFVEHGGVAAHPFQSTQQALDDPDVLANGHVVEVDDPRGLPALGGEVAHRRPKMRAIGLVARLTGTPGEVRGAIPAAGEHTRQVLEEPRASWQASGTGDRSGRPALDGVTVLDFSTIIAAPLGMSHLADLGARVIKVEQPGGDPWRWMGNGSLGAIKTNAGKESIAIDLKAEAGQSIIRPLIAQADLIVHNYRPGVPERLGIGYEQARAIRPDIVYLSANGYGAHGPGAHLPATHPIPGAAIGGAAYQSAVMPTGTSLEELREGARRLFRANEVNPDPSTSAVIATAAMLGLWARHRTGAGQQIFVDMLGANAYANADDFFWYEGREERPPVDADLYGTGPLYRLYRCREGWVFLGVVLEREWRRFCERAGRPDLARDPRFETRAARQQHAAALAALLEQLFLADTAGAWERLLAGAGIGCVRADGPLPGDFWYTDPQVKANDLTTTVVYGEHGPYERHGPVVRLQRTPPRLGPAPMAGEHTDAILRALGYDAAAIARLRAAGVVWSEPAVAARGS